MTRLHRLWTRHTRCRNTTHERDWGNGYPNRCRNCHTPMPLEPGRCYVGLTNTAAGD